MAFWNRSKRKPAIRALNLGDLNGFSLFGDVTAETSMRLAAVYAAVSLLSKTIGSLPAFLMQLDEKGNRNQARKHPLYRLLKIAPNELMSPADFFEALMAALLLRGNAYVRIYRSTADGSVTALVPISPDRVTVKATEDGRSLLYFVDGEVIPLTKADVWHIRGFTLDGLTGCTPITYARETFGLSFAAEKATAAAFKNASMPSGILSAEGEIDRESAKELQKDWQEAHSGNKTGTVAVVGNGLKFAPLSMSPADAGWIEARKFQRTEIAALFQVPVHMIGSLEKATWANVESLGLEFVTYSLRTWIVKIEQSFLRDVLLPSEQDEGYYLRINVDALLRGDFLSRTQAVVARVQNGLLSPNEGRALEDLNGRPGGDEFLVPANLQVANPFNPGAPL